MVGDQLRQAREEAGLSIKDIEKATSIRSLYIEAIENGSYDVLPADVYTKGFIRNYARLLKLDGPALVDRFLLERQGGGRSSADASASKPQEESASDVKPQAKPAAKPVKPVEKPHETNVFVKPAPVKPEPPKAVKRQTVTKAPEPETVKPAAKPVEPVQKADTVKPATVDTKPVVTPKPSRPLHYGAESVKPEEKSTLRGAEPSKQAVKPAAPAPQPVKPTAKPAAPKMTVKPAAPKAAAPKPAASKPAPRRSERKKQESSFSSNDLNRSSSGGKGKLIAIIAVVVVILGGTFFAFSGGSDEPKPTPAAQTQQAQPAPEPVKQYDGVEVTATFTADCWTQVKADGKEIFEGTPKKGETMTWNGKENVSVRAGNAGGISISVNGKDQGSMGEVGQVAQKEFTKDSAN